MIIIIIYLHYRASIILLFPLIRPLVLDIILPLFCLFLSCFPWDFFLKDMLQQLTNCPGQNDGDPRHQSESPGRHHLAVQPGNGREGDKVHMNIQQLMY